ncbi:Hypothetical protein NCS54_00273000 [Fusarium falciforme]|uniref:Hypothetical protein n=1 Tax=Fusarium falciforme TaxID=195108 RepID=UPI0023018DD6|nr:Hypothetical protein NCS54_00273000 [Fusarium falciforme]WAO85487.1 Hypothetical protein NCS54_00273000 [Fusarium falciforme]
MMPLHPLGRLQEDIQSREIPADKPPVLLPAELLADQASLLRLVNDNLKLARSDSSSFDRKFEHTRSTSSSYTEQPLNPSRMQSPVSDLENTKPCLGDLSQYSRANDRLSNLRSSSSSGGPTATTAYQAAADAAAAMLEWRRPVTSYHKYELMSSTEELVPDDTTERNSGECQNSQNSSSQTILAHDTSLLKRVTANTQLDGAAEKLYQDSPKPSVQPSQAKTRVIKRSASGISLRSLTRSVKRTRRQVKKLASSAYRSGSRKFGRTYNSIKRRHVKQRQQYSAWKALRRRLKPGDAIKGKPERGFASFSVERSRHGHEEWWKVGVNKYQAPSWMRFGK